MKESNKEIYKNYFGKEPSISIDIDDAEICIQLLEWAIINKNYSYDGIIILKEHLNVLDNIKQAVKNIETIITDIGDE